VRALVVNAPGAEAGIPYCSQVTVVPVLQDSPGGIGAQLKMNGGFAVINQSWQVALIVSPGSLPATASVLEWSINGLLGLL